MRRAQFFHQHGVKSRAFGKVAVIDHGKGIDKEKLGKLLKMMTSSTEGTGGELGTGIGLFVSQQMMERNGGTIAMESEEGVGTTVTLCVKK